MNTIHDSDFDLKEDQPSMTEIVNMLDEMKNEHFTLLDSLIPANRQPTDAISHFLVAVLRRSHALIEGFLDMVEKRNRTCAVPLIRPQLDNAMRVFATCNMVPDRSAFVKHMLNRGRLHDFKSKSGKKLTDSLLHQELSEKYQPFSKAYDHSCGFIHMSHEHLFSVLDYGSMKRGKAFFSDYRRLPEWPDEWYELEIVEFTGVTHVLLEEARELASLRRKSMEKDNPVPNAPAPQANQE